MAKQHHLRLPSHHINILLLTTAAAPPPLVAAQTQASISQYKYEFSTNFNLELTVIVVVLVLAFFFIGFFSIYIRHCVENSDIENTHSNHHDGRNSHLQRTAVMKGLELSVIESFPIFVYKDIEQQQKINKGLECAVCISKFEEGESLRLLPECDHVFHPQCIDVWLASHSTCPVCRANLGGTELRAQSDQRGEGGGAS